MTDSDSDLLSNNVYSFQNETTRYCVKGPNLNESLSSRTNMYNQRSIYNGRSTAKSLCDHRSIYYDSEAATSTRGLNFKQHDFSSQRSMFNGRCGSPMSVRTMDSNASLSVIDIAYALKNNTYTKFELKILKDSYNKYVKSRIGKIKKRPKQLVKKSTLQKPGDVSGDEECSSSISSDDCRSIRTDINTYKTVNGSTKAYKENIPMDRLSNYSTKTDFTVLRNAVQNSNMYKDCTARFRRNSFRNMFAVGSEKVNDISQNKSQSVTMTTQKDRFENGFQLPFQRFNKPITASSIPEGQNKLQYNNKYDTNYLKKPSLQQNSHALSNVTENSDNEVDSGTEDIFSQVTHREKSPHNSIASRKKRTSEDVHDVSSKKSKLSSCEKINIKTTKPASNKITVNPKNNKNTYVESEDFVFAKPNFPLKRTGNVKSREILIAKSSQPLTEDIHLIHNNDEFQSSECHINQEKEQSETTQHSTSDVSMRPSFMKRKLFTQTLDVTENKNISSNSLPSNSPQTKIYSQLPTEKNKTRKLVTNQSCLSRDVIQDDSNFLDLIHKIVPPDCMNITNITNKIEKHPRVRESNPVDSDKWDVTSIISTCNDIDNESDTYTDEEIFKISNNSKIKRSKKTIKKSKENTKENCVSDHVKKIQTVNPISETNGTNKKDLYHCVESFWNTDTESDDEKIHCNNKSKGKSNDKISPTKIVTTVVTTVPEIKKPVSAKLTKNSSEEKDESINRTKSKNLRLRERLTLKTLKCCAEPNKSEQAQNANEHSKSIQINSSSINKDKGSETQEPPATKTLKCCVDLSKFYIDLHEPVSGETLKKSSKSKQIDTPSVNKTPKKQAPRKTKSLKQSNDSVSSELIQSITCDSLNSSSKQIDSPSINNKTRNLRTRPLRSSKLFIQNMESYKSEQTKNAKCRSLNVSLKTTQSDSPITTPRTQPPRSAKLSAKRHTGSSKCEESKNNNSCFLNVSSRSRQNISSSMNKQENCKTRAPRATKTVKSKQSQNEKCDSFFRSLRSRQIDLSSSFE